MSPNLSFIYTWNLLKGFRLFPYFYCKMFDILIKSSSIYAISQYGGTGFSNEISQIYNIPYHNISDHVF